MSRLVFALLAIYSLVWAESAVALVLGAALALTLGNAFAEQTKSFTPRLLSLSVIGLGAGMNLVTVAHVGAHGLLYTAVTLGLAFGLGAALAFALKVEANTAVLITVGTAICGGSAIAATAPVLRAKAHEISVALGIVFLLNALALVIFPPIGHALGLSQPQFGLWSALAIHDTSSVVGASMKYGAEALEIGTTTKLARALWIVPVTFLIGLTVARVRPGETGEAKPKKPWFILGFLIMAAIVTWIPETKAAGHIVELCARRTLVLTLFLIGTNLSKETIKAVGARPFIQGILLWIAMASVTLIAVTQGWIAV